MSGERPSGYEEVRDALRERGYLHAPLERLFVGGPAGARGLLSAAALSGLLAGLPLGVLLAIALVIESRGLVPAWPDGVLYALMFTAVLAPLVALAEAVAGLLIRALRTRRADLSPRRAALAAGMLVAGTLALYLGAWWARSEGRRSTADLAALAVLAAGAGFAGRVVSAAALIQAAFVAGRAPQARPRFALVMIAVPVGLAAAAAALTAWGASAERRGAPVAVRTDAPAQAVLVAWDGLSRDVTRALVRRGATPWLGSMVAAGSEVTVDVPASSDPVAVWTSLATGCPPAVHGLTGAALRGLPGTRGPAVERGLAAGPIDLLTRLLPTRERPVRSGVRRVPALWEVAADARKTAIVQWWATWPAAAPGAAGGYVVSDGALVAARRGRGVGEAVSPETWGEGRARGWLAEAEALAGAALPLESGGREAADAHEALVTDLFALGALEEALKDPELKVAVVYLPGLDILRERWRRAGRDLFETLDAAAVHAAIIDRRLGEILGPPGPGELTAIVGLPGRAAAGERGTAIFVPGTPPAAGAAPPVAPLDAIAPTWLAMAGFTIDDRICGAPLPGLAAPGFSRGRTRAAAPPSGAVTPALEQDVMDRLKSLGYVD